MPGRRDQEGKAISEAISARVVQHISESLGRPSLPEGTITIVFTDVEGSTELLASVGAEEARARLRRHQEVVREALERHGGLEVERAGDGFMLAFTSATRAVAFAIDLQERLGQEAANGHGVRVRIGIDTGDVLREDRGYYGTPVNRAARITALARGGQILVSEATKVLAQGQFGGFQDAGERELKGLPGSHPIYEVGSLPELPE